MGVALAEAPEAPLSSSAEDRTGRVAPVGEDISDREARSIADKKGAFGIGLGLGAPVTNQGGWSPMTAISMRYWATDGIALEPEVQIGVNYSKSTDDTEKTLETDKKLGYNGRLGMGMMFSVYRGKSTRVNLGTGFMFLFGGAKTTFEYKSETSTQKEENTSKTLGFAIPLRIAMEQHIVDWFSINAGVGFDLINYTKTTIDDKEEKEKKTEEKIGFDINTTKLYLALMFYTN